MTEFAEKVRSIGTGLQKGKTKTTNVIDERDGSIAGKQIEHWSDRVDAKVVAKKPIRYGLRREDD